MAVRATKKSSSVDMIAASPISSVKWVNRDTLHPNGYNPNRVAPPELDLLLISILEDGWTQPIVINEHNEIVDGFHRWTVSGLPVMHDIYHGLVPVVLVKLKDGEHQQMSTIRHNRARGTHGILPMGKIVRDLVASGLSEQEVGSRLKMESEEIKRLLMTQGVTSEVSGTTYNKAWRTGKKLEK